MPETSANTARSHIPTPSIPRVHGSWQRALVLVLTLGVAACGQVGFEFVTDGGSSDATGLDAAGLDAAGLDAGGLDAGGLDAGGLDAGGLDAMLPSTCNDSIRNGAETDVDCGGVCEMKCGDGQDCGVPADCVSGMCSRMLCVNTRPGRYDTGFETFDDWTISGDALWECGAQSDDAFGPPTGTSGNSVCGTRLNANYEANSATGFLTSPTLSLSAMLRAQFSFWMDLEAEINTCGADFTCDGAHVELSVNGGPFVPLRFGDAGLQGSLPNALSIAGNDLTAGWAETQPPGEWGEVVLDLYRLETPGLEAITSMDTIQVRFVFAADSAVSDLPGWYIDDVSLDEAMLAPARAYPYLQDFESTDGWVTSGGGDIWRIGPQSDDAFGPPSGVSGSGVAGTGLNANYELSPTSTRHLQSYLSSPAIRLTGASRPILGFWMAMESRGGQDGGHLALSVNDGPFVLLDFGDPGLTGSPYTDDGGLTAANWPSGDGWSGELSAGAWVLASVDLFALTTPGLEAISSDDTIHIRFGFVAGRNDSSRAGWYIDDVTLSER